MGRTKKEVAVDVVDSAAVKNDVDDVKEDIVIGSPEENHDCYNCIVNYTDPEEPPKSKKRWEWSKWVTAIVATVFGTYSIWSGIVYFKLCKLAIETGGMMPDCTLPVTCVTTVIASVWGYCAYQGLLKSSLNKNQLTIDQDGVVKKIAEFANSALNNISR